MLPEIMIKLSSAMNIGKLFVVFSIAFLGFTPQIASAQQIQAQQEEKVEATITTIKEEKMIDIMDKKQLYQKMELQVTSGSKNGKTITVENGNVPVVNVRDFKVGEKVIVTISKMPDGKDFYTITDYVRRDALAWLFGIFVAMTIIIGGIRGAASLFGMGISFAVIFLFILPQISAGNDPILIAIIGAVFIIPSTFYLSHGFNKKTTFAVIGTLIALTLTGVLASTFVEGARLTGLASEEAVFIQAMQQNTINIKGLLLAGIIIGVLGILDDITISQAAIVSQLKKTNPKLSFQELYARAMDIGKDHIASVVNTLVLVYTGAALPLLLLFINNPLPFSDVINYEILAEEIVRTLVASIGLIMAVPLTTFLTSYFLTKK